MYVRVHVYMCIYVHAYTVYMYMFFVLCLALLQKHCFVPPPPDLALAKAAPLFACATLTDLVTFWLKLQF